LLKKSIEELAALIRTRAVSPVEVLEAQLRHIEKLNPQLNAIVTLAPDALERAREAEARIMRGEMFGPLHGVPLTIKDTIETKGLRTTSGSRVRARYVPEEDAPAVARLKAAGALVLGKTNVSEMAMAYDAENPVFGRTSNPHELCLTSGGSSGGEAASIAACLSFAGLGSDLMGSIRVPAHFCGIFGLKPTTGSIPLAGHFPPSLGPLSLGASLGPLARQASDLLLLFRVLAGFNPSASRSASLQKGARVCWYTDDGNAPVTQESRRAVERVARVFEEAGCSVFEGRPPGIERGPELWSRLFPRAALNAVRELYLGQEESAGPLVRAVFEAQRGEPAPDALDQFIKAWMERDLLRASLIDWMQERPLLIAPVGAVPAFLHGARKVFVEGETLALLSAFGYSQTFNVYGLPAVCVPAGQTAEGLPIGVQLVGRPFEEEFLMTAALLVERALGGWQPPKILSTESTHPL
jgi:amidase